MIRVGTYNVRYSGIDEGPSSWDRRRDGVAATIRALSPDLLATQEVWLEQLPDLRDRLPYDWIAHPDDSGPHTPIAYRPERFRVETQGAYGLAPGGERSVLGWDAAYPRTVTHARLTDRRTGRPVTVASVHLDNEGATARREGARLLLDRLPDGPVILAGDYNCVPNTEPYRLLTERLTDTADAAPDRLGPRETYVGFDDDATARRLDYLFTRGCTVHRHRVGTPDGQPSDHRPVVADLTVER